jgi:hypothetical protein
VSIEDTLTVPVDQVDQIEKTYICSDSNLWKGEIDSRIQYTGLIPIFVSYKFKENAFLGWACASPSPHLGPKCKVVWLIDGVAQDSSMETFSSLKNISRTKYFEEGGVHTICAKVINLATSESQFFCKEIDFEPWNYLYGYVNLKNYQAQVSDSFQVELFGLNHNKYLSTKTTFLGDTGLNFRFTKVPPDDYLVRASPISGSIVDNYSSTYMDSSLIWNGATIIRVDSFNNYVGKLIYPVRIQSQNGPGILQGFITGVGNICTTQIAGLGARNFNFTSKGTRILVLSSSGAPIATTLLNDDGTFYLENLPVGSYNLKIEHPGINSVLIPIVFTQASPALVVQATVTAGGVSTITKTRKNILLADLDVFPNPTTGKIQIQEFDKIETITLINSLGKQLEIKLENETDIEKLSSGIYCLEGKMKDGRIYKQTILKN